MPVRAMRSLCRIIILVFAAGILTSCTVIAEEFNIGLLAEFATVPKDPIFSIELGMHNAPITSIDVDESNQWLVTGSKDKTVRVWDISTLRVKDAKGEAKLVGTLRPPIGEEKEGEIYSVAISPDGKTIACGGLTQFNDGRMKRAPNGHNIYIFDRETGKLVRRIGGLYNPTKHLAYSKDGRFLAANSRCDMSVYRTSDYSLLNQSPGGASADFGGDGSLLTTRCIGGVLLYSLGVDKDGSFKLVKAEETPGGNLPYSAMFSPDRTKIAVGFEDSTKINVFSGKDLSYLYSPDTSDLIKDNLNWVAWSSDGRNLFAGGSARNKSGGKQTAIIRGWSDQGRGPHFDLAAADSEITQILPLKDGSIAYGTTSPSFGVYQKDGTRSIYKTSYNVNHRDNEGSLLVSNDGSKIKYDKEGKSNAVFDIKQRTLERGDGVNHDLSKPIAAMKGILITDTKSFLIDKVGDKEIVHPNMFKPLLNGKALYPFPFVVLGQSICFTIAPDGSSFLFGEESFLRLFDSSGSEKWKIVVPAQTYNVNISGNGKMAVAALGDGTIRWFRMSDGKELLAFFPHKDKKRWVMWTPEGYYDASPGGEDLIGWHLNQGKDKEARFIPNGQLYDVFFRPDIVQAKINGDDISGLVAITAKEALKNPPPLLSFTKVPSSSKNNKENVCYKAISTGGGIGEVRLFQNGKLVKSDGFYREASAKESDATMKLASQGSESIQRGLRSLTVAQKNPSPIASSDKGNEYEECQELDTMPGENEISVAAFNATNTIQSGLETARFKNDRKPEEPHLYVLGIGINRYRDPSATLEYAVKDAGDFRAMIQKKAGGLYKPQNIHVEGLSDEAASKEGIQHAIQALSGKVKPWDSFILFVASHGVLLENQYYIVTAGFNGSANPANLISSNEIVGMSKNIRSLSQLFIFDTCHAGGVDNIISGLYDARMSVMAKKMGLHIYASAGSTQSAMDGYQGNGLFTHALLKSMKEGAVTDTNHDRQVSVVELGQEARQETIDISKKLGYPQSPNIINFGRDNALFRVQ